MGYVESFIPFGEGSINVDAGAEFSADRKNRYALWRIWNPKLPLVMFVGLNPSTANETDLDRTVTRVLAFSKNLGFGGFYMMNCFSFVSTDPDMLQLNDDNTTNDTWLRKVGEKCERVIFSWGVFKIVREKERDVQLTNMFPDAMVLKYTKDGYPYHPLYVSAKTQPIPWVYKK